MTYKNVYVSYRRKENIYNNKICMMVVKYHPQQLKSEILRMKEKGFWSLSTEFFLISIENRIDIL